MWCWGGRIPEHPETHGGGVFRDAGGADRGRGSRRTSARTPRRQTRLADSFIVPRYLRCG